MIIRSADGKNWDFCSLLIPDSLFLLKPATPDDCIVPSARDPAFVIIVNEAILDDQIGTDHVGYRYGMLVALALHPFVVIELKTDAGLAFDLEASNVRMSMFRYVSGILVYPRLLLIV